MEKSWNSDDDKDMDEMAKSIAKKDTTLSKEQVTVMVMKDKLAADASNSSSGPQGHQTLQTETDNMMLSDHAILKKMYPTETAA